MAKKTTKQSKTQLKPTKSHLIHDIDSYLNVEFLNLDETVNQRQCNSPNQIISKKKTNPSSKTRNIPKFIIKLMQKILPLYSRYFRFKPAMLTQLSTKLQQLINNYHNNPDQNYLGVNQLKDLLCNTDDLDKQLLSQMTRLVIGKAIGGMLKKEVLLNKRVTQKKTYLNALKVYRLRLRNCITASRFTSQ